jgi:hypothetical protein
MVEDAMRGDIDLAPFVTHTMGLEEINEALRTDARRQVDPHGHSLLTRRSEAARGARIDNSAVIMARPRP